MELQAAFVKFAPSQLVGLLVPEIRQETKKPRSFSNIDVAIQDLTEHLADHSQCNKLLAYLRGTSDGLGDPQPALLAQLMNYG